MLENTIFYDQKDLQGLTNCVCANLMYLKSYIYKLMYSQLFFKEYVFEHTLSMWSNLEKLSAHIHVVSMLNHF